MPIIVIMFYWCLIACDWLAIFFFSFWWKIKLEMLLCIGFILLSAQTLHDRYQHLFNAISTTVVVVVDVLSICMTSWHEHAFRIARLWRVYLVVSLNYLLNEESSCWLCETPRPIYDVTVMDVIFTVIHQAIKNLMSVKDTQSDRGL